MAVIDSPRGRLAARVACAAALLCAVAYLRDPPWIGRVTSGLRDWEEYPRGTRFRWTTGHASFFVSSEASAMTLPVRTGFPGPDGRPVTVELTVDDRWLARLELSDPAAWIEPTLPLPRRRTRRRYRRIDLRVDRTAGWLNLGVQLGEIRLTMSG
jgi:hypothetical protein